jgi:hypothetical protein
VHLGGSSKKREAAQARQKAKERKAESKVAELG